MGAAADNEAGRSQEAEKHQMKERVLQVLLTSEARQRLMNVKMVRPQVAKSIEDYLIQQASTGKLNRRINDEELQQILSSIQQPKKEFKIRWI